MVFWRQYVSLRKALRSVSPPNSDDLTALCHPTWTKVLSLEGNLPPPHSFQVEGAQALADATAVVLDILALKVEMSFPTFWPPHSGHSISEVEVLERTSFSNLPPHSRHRYS